MGKVKVPEDKKYMKLKDLLSVPEAGSGVMRDPELDYQNDPKRLSKAVSELRKPAASNKMSKMLEDKKPDSMHIFDLPSPDEGPDAAIFNPSKKEIEDVGNEAVANLVEPKAKDSFDWKTALIPAITTGIGSIFGGYKGGASGAQVGSQFVKDVETEKEKDRAKVKDKAKLDFMLGEKGMKYDDENGKVVMDEKSPYWSNQLITNQSKLATIYSVLGKIEGDKARAILDQQKLNLEEKKIDQNKQIEMAKIGAKSAGASGISKEAGNLRKEFTGLKEVKDFKEVATQYEKIKRASANPSPANDLSLIFGQMKMQDPVSTVREGEFATAANAGSVSDKIRNQYNKLLNGERLTPEQRADFLQAAESMYQAQKMNYDSATSKYKDLADQYKVNPSLLFGREQQQSAPAPSPQPKPITQVWQGKTWQLIDPSKHKEKSSWKVIGE